jgi:UDP-N-acetylmuramate--alanine ligase
MNIPKLHNVSSVHMVGIGGIGMSGLAQLLASRGIQVSGSDLESSPVFTNLQGIEGISVYLGSDPEILNSDVNMLIYSPAVPETDPERLRATEHNIPQYSYPEVLGAISNEKFTVTISGTNGKTTTTSMIVETLVSLGHSPEAIVGELLQKYNSNYITGTDDLFVVEACEYKDSFLNISHNICLITNITEDHLDYFSDLQDIQDSFTQYLNNKKGQGVLVCNTNLPELKGVIEQAQTLGMNVINYAHYLSDDLQVTIPGEHNKQNAAACLGVIEALKGDVGAARTYLQEGFKGAKRRFEYLGTTTSGALVIDDYAHNPEGLSYLIEALRSSYPEKKLVMMFEPHLYSRTFDFKESFGEVLSGADELYLFPTYRAREAYDEEQAFLLEQYIDTSKVQLTVVREPQEVLARIKTYDDSHVIVSVGAGDIWQQALKLLN